MGNENEPQDKFKGMCEKHHNFLPCKFCDGEEDNEVENAEKVLNKEE